MKLKELLREGRVIWLNGEFREEHFGEGQMGQSDVSHGARCGSAVDFTGQGKEAVAGARTLGVAKAHVRV